jgi:hypothetical protein
MELTREQEMQAYTDALGAIVTAVAWQVDPIRLLADLKLLAGISAKAGNGPSAGLIDELARTVERRVLGSKAH